ncbi:Structural maintenance of chromosomes protein 6 [Batrachochytrium dendrobatidis]|nr:Structural maintenance of chromosomes protein 6 [Batrachochytrium dendrobatidis]
MASTAPSRGRMKRVPVKRSVDENDSTTDDMTIEKESSNPDLKRARKEPRNNLSMDDIHSDTRLSEMEPSQQHQITDNDALGTIERVELVNFMCHSYLQVSLGSKINFIVGHNGSGKSAILTALTVCLGGKAGFTNRGNNLKALIKTGEDVASVTVKIRNKGPDAYKASVYGDSITVERKIVRDGQNSYKIRDVHGHTVSTSHGDLMSINDHMQIVVDNPMAILTQDTARMFLANSSSHDKYLFFLKGTQLEKLTADYVLIDEYIESATRTLCNKVQAVPEMKEDVERLRRQLREIDEAAKIEEEFHQYNAEYIWSKIEEQEQRIRDQAQLVEQEQQKLAIVEPKIIQCEVDLSTAQTNAQTLSTQLSDALGEKTALDTSRKNHTIQIKSSRQVMRQLSASMSELDREAALRQSNIQRLQGHIDAEQKKVQVDQAAIRDDKLEKIKSLGASRSDSEKTRRNTLQLRDDIEARLNKLKTEQGEIQEYVNDKMDALARSEDRLKQLHDQKVNKLRMFGERMPEIVRMINEYDRNGRWRGKKPIGPLGMYVQLEREEFSYVVESLLSSSLSAMVVDNHDDMRLMQDIAKKCGFPHMTVFKCSAKSVNFQSGEPDQNLLTVYRSIKVSDPTVLGQLVINNSIEKTALVCTRNEGDELAKNGYPRNVNLIATQDGYTMGNQFGGYSASRLFRPPNTPHLAKNLDALESNLLDEINRHTQSLDKAKSDLQTKERQFKDASTQRNHLRSEIAKLDQRIGQLSRDITEIEDSMREDDSININVFEDEKREEQARLDILLQQYDGIVEQINAQKEIASQQTASLQTLDDQISEIESRVSMLTNEVDTISTQLAHQKKNLDYYVGKRAEYIRRVDVQEQLHIRLQTALDLNLAKCQEIGDRVPVTHDVEYLCNKIRDLRARLEEKEKQFGSREKVCNELLIKQKSYDDATREIKESDRFLKFLSKSLAQRNSAYEDFKKYISIRAKRMFSELIRKRGFRGTLKLDHQARELNLHVDVGDAEKSGQSIDPVNDRDPKALSGGEKSFATVCLLLALWESMASPFRALDEFDVFMDAVNRRLAMKLMVDNARDAESQSQYILITPQNMSHVQGIGGPDVRVSRLVDPERNQPRLSFGKSSN